MTEEPISEALVPERELTVGDAVRVLEEQLSFWRRTAFIFGGGLAFASIIILVGLGALLSIASNQAEAADDAKVAAESNGEVLEIIKEQTGPAAAARSKDSVDQILKAIDCGFRQAAVEAGLEVPDDFLDGCEPSSTATTTEEP